MSRIVPASVQLRRSMRTCPEPPRPMHPPAWKVGAPSSVERADIALAGLHQRGLEQGELPAPGFFRQIVVVDR